MAMCQRAKQSCTNRYFYWIYNACRILVWKDVQYNLLYTSLYAVHFTLRIYSWSPFTPYILSTNHSFRARNRLPSGICQCCWVERFALVHRSPKIKKYNWRQLYSWQELNTGNMTNPFQEQVFMYSTDTPCSSLYTVHAHLPMSNLHTKFPISHNYMHIHTRAGAN